MPYKDPEYLKNWKKANPDKVEAYRLKELPKAKARGRKWYYMQHEENKKFGKEYQKEWVKNNKEKRKGIVRKAALKRYGLTEESYEQLLKEQNYYCAICPKQKSTTRNNLHIDHDHVTGRVRGLLCSKCNTAIGLLDESLERMNKAVSYLSRRNQ